MIVEGAVLGWFVTMFVREAVRDEDPVLAPAEARRCPPAGAGVIGCDYERPRAHLPHYRDGAVHLHNSRCVFEPPPER